MSMHVSRMASINTGVVVLCLLEQQNESSCKSRVTEEHLWLCMMFNVLLESLYLHLSTRHETTVPSAGNIDLKPKIL